MNAELYELWAAVGGWRGLAEYISMIPDPEEQVRYRLEMAKLLVRKEVTGDGGGPVLIQLKQL